MSRQRIVYRVQDPEGRSPWKPGFSHKWIDAESARPLFPDVISAFGLLWLKEIPEGWSCGCATLSMDKLREWILPIERERLTILGYAPVAMFADEIIRANPDQVIFVRRKKLTVGTMGMRWQDNTIVSCNE